GDTQAARELTLVEAAVAQLGFQPCPEAASMPIGITTTHAVIMLDRYSNRHYNSAMRNSTERYTGTKIGMVLREQGRRQDWLATRIGVTPATVNRWIHGTRSIDRKDAVKVAAVLDVPFSLLFDMPIGIVRTPKGKAVA